MPKIYNDQTGTAGTEPKGAGGAGNNVALNNNEAVVLRWLMLEYAVENVLWAPTPQSDGTTKNRPVVVSYVPYDADGEDAGTAIEALSSAEASRIITCEGNPLSGYFADVRARFRALVFNHNTHRIEALVQRRGVFKSMFDAIGNRSWGDPRYYDFSVTKKQGARGQYPEYVVVPQDKNTELPAEVWQELQSNSEKYLGFLAPEVQTIPEIVTILGASVVRSPGGPAAGPATPQRPATGPPPARAPMPGGVGQGNTGPATRNPLAPPPPVEEEEV